MRCLTAVTSSLGLEYVIRKVKKKQEGLILSGTYELLAHVNCVKYWVKP